MKYFRISYILDYYSSLISLYVAEIVIDSYRIPTINLLIYQLAFTSKFTINEFNISLDLETPQLRKCY
jgi:hypothetical protein